VSHHEFETASPFDETEVEPIRAFGIVPGMLGLAVLGLIVFAGGIVWATNAKDRDGGLFSGMATVGWGLGVVGIVCVALAVYFLLERLGGREEQ
jgi:hypothetical protein